MVPPLYDDNGDNNRVVMGGVDGLVELSEDCDEAEDIGACYKEK